MTEQWIGHWEEDKLREVLVGRKIVDAELKEEGWNPEGVLTLDDGTKLVLEGNEGGCACSSGDYFLKSVAKVDNIITNVTIREDPAEDYGDGEGVYEIYVIADNEQINVARFEGDDGNGYYGTGFSVRVIPPEPNTRPTPAERDSSYEEYVRGKEG